MRGKLDQPCANKTADLDKS